MADSSSRTPVRESAQHYSYLADIATATSEKALSAAPGLKSFSHWRSSTTDRSSFRSSSTRCTGLPRPNSSISLVAEPRSVQHPRDSASVFAFSITPSWISGGASQRERTACLASRSEEHTSELQSRGHLVCRLLLEK